MSPETWKKVKSIFNEADELPKSERTPFLAQFDEEIRLEVKKMLNVIEDENLLLNDPIVDFRDFADDSIPEKIGDYKIIREIGHGGMGTVYEAIRETENFTQKVALKVIKRGMNNEIILRRFRSEQQILATLEHPNIGRFLDGGKTKDGSPFYAMELIEGLPIDEFCWENNLSIEEKVKIFREVCSAVSYAHTNLIVHRDLKPSNIIVTKERIPKLLDFGIAKVLNIDSKELGTATQLGMMTPQYASPEQIRGEKVTTLSDVYSLGIIFYEILTGEKPYQTDGKTYAEILDIVTQTNLAKPSDNLKSAHQNPKLKGDLDTIILKALQKEPARRYQSVEQVSEDLRRHLVGLPISARPDTFQYRFSKFVERNRIGVAAACLVFLSLLAGISAASWQTYRAEKQKILAEKRFAEVRTIANKVVFKYHDEIEKLNGSTTVREMLVQDATDYLDNLAKDAEEDADLEHELALAYLKLGDVQGKLYAANTGNTAGALASCQKAINLLEKVVTAKPNEISAQDSLIKAYDSMVSLMARTTASAGEKQNLLNKTAKIIEEIFADEQQNTKRLSQLTMLYIRYGDSVGGLADRDSLLQKLEYHLKALTFADEFYLADPQNPESLRMLARANQRIGTDYFWLGENAEMNNLSESVQSFFKQALPYHKKMFESIEKLAQIIPNDPNLMRNQFASHTSFAETLSRNNRKQEALELAKTTMTLAKQIQANDAKNREASFDIALTYELFSKIYLHDGKEKEGYKNLQKALEYSEEVFKTDENNLEALVKINEYCNKLIKLCEKNGNQIQAKFYQNRLTEIKKISASISRQTATS